MTEIGLKKRQSVRFSDLTWEELGAIAAHEQERTRENVGVSVIVRRFVQEGIARWKREEAKAKRELREGASEEAI